jgi:hypothetical protein
MKGSSAFGYILLLFSYLSVEEFSDLIKSKQFDGSRYSDWKGIEFGSFMLIDKS